LKIIDIHTDIYPDAIARKATDSIRDFYQLDGGGMDGSVQMLRERGAQAGISRYVVLPVSNSPKRVRHINEFLLEESRKYDDFIGFGTLHAGMDGLMEETQWILQNGLKGIKMHPDSQQFNIDDERLFPLYERLREWGMPLFVHCGDEQRDFSHPRHLRRLIDRFPGLTVIAAHLGGWSKWDEAVKYLAHTDCYLDISSCMMFLPPERVVDYILAFGVERILFGTDFPIWDVAGEVRNLMALPLTDEEKEQIFFRNAQRILGKEI
jgi:predicted TIM-barrel fold metal-dependent hydrolase